MALLNTIVNIGLEESRIEFPYTAIISTRGVVVFDEITASTGSQVNRFPDKTIPQGSISDLSYYEDPTFNLSGVIVNDSRLTDLSPDIRNTITQASIGLNIARDLLGRSFNTSNLVALGSPYGQLRILNSMAAQRASIVFINPPFPVDLIRFNEVFTLQPRWYIQEMTVNKETAGSQIEVELTFINKLQGIGGLSGLDGVRKIAERIIL